MSSAIKMRIYALTVLLATVTVIALPPDARAQGQRRVSSSLLLLIDASGSMGDPIGSGNPEVKIEAAKRAASAALSRTASSGSVEVAVLAFRGDCQDPVPRYQDFTRDVSLLTRFINSLQPGGGTPMADALLFANRFLDRNGSAGASDRMIMLLADGQNDCGDVGQSMAELKASGVIFRHETVGFGITPNSAAAQDLRQIATQTGGAYHHAADASQLSDVFMEFVDTLSVIDMLGMFGKGASGAGASPSRPATAAAAQKRGAQQPGTQKQVGKRGLSRMIGGIKAKPPAGVGAAANSSKPAGRPLFGALAIDSNQGPNWGWSIDYPTPEAAERRALSECGEQCRVVMKFSGECAAYAADQAKGSTVYSWANGYQTGSEARGRALSECQQKGGTSCIVRSWGCTRR